MHTSTHYGMNTLMCCEFVCKKDHLREKTAGGLLNCSEGFLEKCRCIVKRRVQCRRKYKT